MRYKVIEVEDTKESLTNAMQEMTDALMKGSGIGFDVSRIKSKSKQLSFVEKLDDHTKLLTTGKRTSQ